MENIPPEVWAAAHMLVARNATHNGTSTSTSAADPARPGYYKVVGLTLAVASGLFIGTSFVLKKTGLLKANEKYNEEAGEGYGYLKNAFWWSGMTLMIVGEICNFVAYAFVDAILVTPLGALSVVVTTILSAIFLKERLSFVGKIGCFNCIVGSVIIVVNAPEQSAVSDIQAMQHYVIAPGFLSYAGVLIIGSAFIALWVGPRYGKKTMLVYLSVCSLIGGLSVVATQGLGAAIVAQAGGEAQFNHWFLYVLLVFVIATLLTEIIFLNKALNLFNAALVTPTYYVFFTSATIITSAVLFQGFHGTLVSQLTVVGGFLVICSGVVLLQLSKSAKDVPDSAVFKGDLDQMREIAEVEQPETEPKADAIRGAAAIIRRISVSRQKWEQQEAQRLREEKMADNLEPLQENEVVQWDGLRRRKTIIGQPGSPSPIRRKTVHPPLGMSSFPEETEEQGDGPTILDTLRERTKSVLHRPKHAQTEPAPQSPMYPVALTDIRIHAGKSDSPIVPYGPGSFEEAQEHIYGRLPTPNVIKQQELTAAGAQPSPRSKPLPAKPLVSPALRPQPEGRRQFSFNNLLHRKSGATTPGDERPSLSRGQSRDNVTPKKALKNATEEERLGLVKGDSHQQLLERTRTDSPERLQPNTYLSSEKHGYQRASSHSPQRYPPRADSVSSESDRESWQITSPQPKDELEEISFVPNHPRTLTPVSTPERTRSGRQRPSPPRVYHPPAPLPPYEAPNSRTVPLGQGTMSNRGNQQQAPSTATAAAGRYAAVQNPATSQPAGGANSQGTNSSSRSHIRFLDQASMEDIARTETPAEMSYDEYDESRRRYEEMSYREREERRQRHSKSQGPGQF